MSINYKEYNDFKLARLDAHFTVQQAADFFGRSIRTIQRWESVHLAPSWAVDIMRLRSGNLDCFGGQFKGWRIEGDRIRGHQWYESLLPGEVTYYCTYPVSITRGVSNHEQAVNQECRQAEESDSDRNQREPSQIRLIR